MIAFADAGITTFDCADIYTGVEELIGHFRARYRDAARRGRRSTASRCTPNSCPTSTSCRASPSPMSRASSTSRCGGCGRSGSTSCSSTGGTMPCRAGWRPRHGSTSCGAPARSTRSAAPISTPTRMLAMIESGVPLVSMQVQYSLLDSRRAQAMAAAAAEERRLAALLRHGRRRLPGRPLAGRRRAGKRLREPLAHQIQADHRRFRRLGAVPGAACNAARHRRPARQRHRDRGERRDAAAPGRRGGHRRRAQPLASRREPGDLRSRADAMTTTPRSTPCCRAPASSTATCSRWSATARPPRLDHEIQSQQGSRLTTLRRADGAGQVCQDNEPAAAQGAGPNQKGNAT